MLVIRSELLANIFFGTSKMVSFHNCIHVYVKFYFSQHYKTCYSQVTTNCIVVWAYATWNICFVLRSLGVTCFAIQ